MSTESAGAFKYVDTQEALARLTARADAAATIAIDTEANSLHRYFEKVCLIQLSIDDEHFIVDPLAAFDLTSFLDCIAAKRLIFHAADYDLRMMRSSFDFRPAGDVFDTMLAAQLLGHEELGLAAQVQRHFDVTLSKRGQKSDWTRRPLTHEQLAYAVDDTRYLQELAARLTDELASRDRIEWHRQACAKMVRSAMVDEAPDPDVVWRIRGLGKCGPRELAFVREIWRWRDSQARKADRPSFKIFGNQHIIDIALWAASAKNGVAARVPNLPKNIGEAQHKGLLKTIRRVQNMSESEWPGLRRKKGSPGTARDLKPTIEALRTECGRIAASLEIPPSVLAPRAAMEAIVRADARTAEQIRGASALLPWQAELLAPVAARVLER